MIDVVVNKVMRAKLLVTLHPIQSDLRAFMLIDIAPESQFEINSQQYIEPAGKHNDRFIRSRFYILPPSSKKMKRNLLEQRKHFLFLFLRKEVHYECCIWSSIVYKEIVINLPAWERVPVFYEVVPDFRRVVAGIRTTPDGVAWKSGTNLFWCMTSTWLSSPSTKCRIPLLWHAVMLQKVDIVS